jgi:hypothetical protein
MRQVFGTDYRRNNMCEGCGQKDRENGSFVFCLRNGIILKENVAKCPLFKGAKNTKQQVQADSLDAHSLT